MMYIDWDLKLTSPIRVLLAPTSKMSTRFWVKISCFRKSLYSILPLESKTNSMSAGLFPQSADSKRMNNTQSFSYQQLVCFLLLGLLGFLKKKTNAKGKIVIRTAIQSVLLLINWKYNILFIDNRISFVLPLCPFVNEIWKRRTNIQISINRSN